TCQRRWKPTNSTPKNWSEFYRTYAAICSVKGPHQGVKIFFNLNSRRLKRLSISHEIFPEILYFVRFLFGVFCRALPIQNSTGKNEHTVESYDNERSE
ncbi:MAG: hypothetical protein ACYSOY_08950, partial [Planctomycetota bacterium]